MAAGADLWVYNAEYLCVSFLNQVASVFGSVRSSLSHPLLLLIHPPPTPLFQIIPVLDTGLSLSEPLQLHQKQSLDSSMLTREACQKLVKGAGTFHSASQSKGS